MNERICNTEAVRSLKHINWFVHKISDVGGTRFTGVKPFDSVACSTTGEFVAIESKLIKKWQKIPRNMLRPNQIISLDDVVLNDGRAFVFLFVRIPRSKNKKGMSKKAVNKLCVIDWKNHGLEMHYHGFTIDDIRNEEVGWWYSPTKDKSGKIIWPIQDILERGFN